MDQNAFNVNVSKLGHPPAPSLREAIELHFISDYLALIRLLLHDPIPLF